MQGGGVYQNNCQANNIQSTRFDGNQGTQGSAIYLNNALPVSLPSFLAVCAEPDARVLG